MNFIVKKYKAFIIGGIITIGVAAVLWGLGFIFTNDAYLFVNIYILIFCWLLISFLSYKIPIYKVIGLVVLFIATMLADNYMEIPDNPITFPLVMLFWLGVAYLILPQFFEKYKIAILSVYGLVLTFFFIFRTMPNYLEDHRGKLINAMFIPIPFFAVLWIYEQWRWLQTLKEEKAKSELTLLKNQINPHFFFNTLNNLYGLAVEKSDQTPAMILKLSDIMRYTIYEAEADVVPLKDEVAYLEDYIDLHKIRYQKQVDISFHKNLQHSHTIAPLLFIIPLENAFKHGVESLVTHAFIELIIRTTPKSIFFWICNNYESNVPEHEGIGLLNLRKRLELIYPNQHQMEIIKTVDKYTVSIEIESL